MVKQPFDPIEVRQCASSLARKWQNEQTLRRHVESLEQVIEDRTRGLEAANRQLRHLATHDSLTGLPNRILLEDRLSQAIAHATRDGHTFAVAIFDLDRFKVINDSFGHGIGDELLKEVARRLQGIARSIDTVVRLGGDEFVMIIDHLAQADRRTGCRAAGDHGSAETAATSARRTYSPRPASASRCFRRMATASRR